MLGGLQPTHLILILIIALVIFGPSRLPELGRSLGKSITEFKNATKDMTAAFEEPAAGTAAPRPVQPQQPVESAAAPVEVSQVSSPVEKVAASPTQEE